MGNKKIKILQLLCFPLYGSGSGTFVRKLSETLISKGHEVAVLAPEKRKVPGLKIYNVDLPFMAVFTGHPEYPDAKLYSQLSGAALNDIQSAFCQRITEAVEEYKPDVIHVHHASNLTWIANYIKTVYQIHYIVTSHNTDVINAVLDKRYISLTQDALNRADVITAVSKNTRERLLHILGKGYTNLTRKTKVVPCGVDTQAFPYEGSVDNVNRKFGLKDKKVALYSGKITAIKGVDIFIRAAKSFPGAVFVIMGDGEEREKMETLIKEAGIKNVILTGYLGSKDKKIISELYRRADLVAVPSTLSEGIPLSALESLSCGTPVVASEIGGLPTAVKHLKNGILVRPKSVSALVSGIKTIFDDPKLAKKMGKQARKDAVQKFDWDVITKKMEKYYELSYARSQKNKATKRPSFVSEEEYREDKELVQQIQQEKGV
jgi:glycosyltransferase involved in cell wall biosynthesis